MLKFEMIYVINNLFGIFVAMRFFNGFLKKKIQTKLRRNINFLIILIIFTSLNILVKNLNISLIIAFTLYLVCAILNFKGRIHIKIVNSIFLVIFSIITELLTALLFMFIFKLQIQYVREYTLFLFLGGVVSKLLLLLIVDIIVRAFSHKASYVSTSSWMLIITMPIISIYISVMSVYESVLSNQLSLGSILLCFSILYINLIAFYLFDSIISQVDENNQMRFREKQLMMQQKQYNNIIYGYENVKRVKHDIMNHLVSLNGYLEASKYQEAKRYIQKLNGDLKSSEKEIISGNIVVDALINNRKKEATYNEINFGNDIVIPFKLNQINDMDLCIILGNTLDNAYEACQRITEKDREKEILLTMKYKDDNLLIHIKNSYNKATIKRAFGEYVSSKDYRQQNSYGIGISNM